MAISSPIFEIVKHFLVIVFTISYFLSVTGLNFNYHYCGNELESIGLAMFADEDTCCGGAEMEDGCCQDEQYELKVKNEQKCNVILILADKPDILSNHLPAFLMFNYTPANQMAVFNYHPPPPKPNNLILDLNCVLRI
jgi:hypothetical protein